MQLLLDYAEACMAEDPLNFFGGPDSGSYPSFLWYPTLMIYIIYNFILLKVTLQKEFNYYYIYIYKVRSGVKKNTDPEPDPF